MLKNSWRGDKMEQDIGNFLGDTTIVQDKSQPKKIDKENYLNNWINKNINITLIDGNEFKCKMLNIINFNSTSLMVVELNRDGRPKHRLVSVNSILFIDGV